MTGSSFGVLIIFLLARQNVPLLLDVYVNRAWWMGRPVLVQDCREQPGKAVQL